METDLEMYFFYFFGGEYAINELFMMRADSVLDFAWHFNYRDRFKTASAADLACINPGGKKKATFWLVFRTLIKPS